MPYDDVQTGGRPGPGRTTAALSEQAMRTAVRRARIQLPLACLFTGLLLFPVSGDWGWGMGWIYLLTAPGLLGWISLKLNLRQGPELLVERASQLQRAPKGEKALLGLAVGGSVVALLVAALQHRHAWAPELPPFLGCLGLMVTWAGYGLGMWAMAVNRFFSSVVRIQTDRGHQVVDWGPYGWVRHPGYLGWLLLTLATPIALGSVWGCIPAFGASLLIVLRTLIEERALARGLAGYGDYCRRVRFRLVPGLW